MAAVDGPLVIGSSPVPDESPPPTLPAGQAVSETQSDSSAVRGALGDGIEAGHADELLDDKIEEFETEEDQPMHTPLTSPRGGTMPVSPGKRCRTDDGLHIGDTIPVAAPPPVLAALPEAPSALVQGGTVTPPAPPQFSEEWFAGLLARQADAAAIAASTRVFEGFSTKIGEVQTELARQ